jgi:hypothetical protein
MKPWILVFLFSVGLFLGCTAPQYIWPQKDIDSYEINPPSLEKKILIASRQSDFKNAVVQKIVHTYQNQPVYFKIIGIENLKNEDPYRYSAIVLINTSMGWKIDRKVKSFLDQYGNLHSIIVLTTSAGGDILPDLKNRDIDAIASASTQDSIDPVAHHIINRIEALIK